MEIKLFKKGDLVEVTDVNGQQLVRKAVEISGDTIYICTPEEFDLSLKKGKEPICVGFKIEFVKPCHG